MNETELMQVQDRPDLYRDPVSGAIINMDKSGADIAKNARKKALNRDKEIQDLKDEISELKDLVKQLIER